MKRPLECACRSQRDLRVHHRAARKRHRDRRAELASARYARRAARAAGTDRGSSPPSTARRSRSPPPLARATAPHAGCWPSSRYRVSRSAPSLDRGRAPLSAADCRLPTCDALPRCRGVGVERRSRRFSSTSNGPCTASSRSTSIDSSDSHRSCIASRSSSLIGGKPLAKRTAVQLRAVRHPCRVNAQPMRHADRIRSMLAAAASDRIDGADHLRARHTVGLHLDAHRQQHGCNQRTDRQTSASRHAHDPTSPHSKIHLR